MGGGKSKMGNQEHQNTVYPPWTLRERVWLRLARILRSVARPGPLTRPLMAACLRRLKSRPKQQLRFGPEVAVTHRDFFTTYNLILFLRLHGSDMEVYPELVTNDEYGSFFRYLARHQNNDPIRRIVDAGSNIGLAALLMAARFPEARILCVEPEPGNLARLYLHLHYNRLKDRCSVKPLALWSRKEKRLQLDRRFRDGKDWSTRVIAGEGNIQGITLASLMQQENWDQIDLLKIDIEGSEKQLLEDPEVAGTFLPHTRFLVVEIHPETTDPARVEQTLRRFSFEFHRDKELIYGRNTILSS